jgi:protein AATF/BFR2
MANRLPQYDIQPDFKENEEIGKRFDTMELNISKSLKELVNLQNALLEQNPRMKCPRIEHDDDSEVLWKSIEAQYEGFTPYRNQSLEEWNRRTKLSSGIDAKNFKSINTSLDSQVKMVLKEKDVLIKKSQKITFEAPILGKRKREEEDPEIFEDKEFYQLLLRDLIEDVGTSLGSKENMRNAIRNNLKKDKKPFRRNRGKEIKYTVHAKLVGFMAPQERELPEGSDKLFANLFGGIPDEFADKITSLID